MSATFASATPQINTNEPDDRGYAWFVANSTELFDIFASDDLLRSLENLELEYNLPSGTARRFKALYDNTTSVSKHEEIRYVTAWDAYHEALDSDRDLAAIAHAYANSNSLPLHRKIDATRYSDFLGLLRVSRAQICGN